MKVDVGRLRDEQGSQRHVDAAQPFAVNGQSSFASDSAPAKIAKASATICDVG
ncbi:hypothetical protein NKJ36_05580 [Mesorhizobium sp. M0142]|uniref:hypothetical protein n=1 Tax=unclassified Mesorhizobium TaxID=325217 RepID=UPI00333880BA